MTELGLLAESVRVSERTLRRAANRGTLRVIRKGPRRTLVSSEEHQYVLRCWPLVDRLLHELRTLPNVRLAVLFGSVARGDDRPDSDLDVLVRLRQDGVRERAHVAQRLESATGRSLQLVLLDDAAREPSLLAEILRDGRVLVDRDGDWPELKLREAGIGREAERADRRLEQEAWAALEELGVS